MRVCTVCRSTERNGIDAALAGGETLAAVARRFNVSRDAARRHREAHLSPALAKVALERVGEESARAALDFTVDRVEGLVGRLEALLSVAEERKSLTAGANVARELRQCLELVAKLRGELDERPQVAVVNVLTTPEFTLTVARLIEALGPWPDARVAAAAVLDAEAVT